MPRPILPQHQAQATTAAAAAPAAAGPDAAPQDGQHAAGGTAYPWRGPRRKRPAFSRTQQWWHRSWDPYIRGYSTSDPTDTNTREHGNAPTTGSGAGGNGDSAATGSTAGCTSPTAPHAPVPHVGAWRWGRDERPPAADGPSATAAAAQRPTASGCTASLQPQTVRSLSNAPVIRQTWTGPCNSTSAAAHPRTGPHACPGPARTSTRSCRDCPQNPASGRVPEADGPDPGHGSRGHDATPRSPSEPSGPDGHVPHGCAGHGPPRTRSGQDHDGAAAWHDGRSPGPAPSPSPAAASAGAASRGPAATQPAVGPCRSSHEPSAEAHDGSHGPTATTRGPAATTPNEPAAEPCDDASDSRGSHPWSRRAGSTTGTAENTEVPQLAPPTAASAQHSALQPHSYGCLYQAEGCALPGGKWARTGGCR